MSSQQCSVCVNTVTAITKVFTKVFWVWTHSHHTDAMLSPNGSVWTHSYRVDTMLSPKCSKSEHTVTVDTNSITKCSESEQHCRHITARQYRLNLCMCLGACNHSEMQGYCKSVLKLNSSSVTIRSMFITSVLKISEQSLHWYLYQQHGCCLDLFYTSCHQPSQPDALSNQSAAVVMN